MTDKKAVKRRLSGEILGLLAVTFILSLFLFQVLTMCSGAIINSYFSAQNIIPTEHQLASLDDLAIHLSILVSAVFFVLLFLILLGDRLSYIHEIIKGIDALQKGLQNYIVPIHGRNELTQLADSVNYLSRTQKEIKEREQALIEEKEQFIRTLSHDIRTPLTSVLSYSEYLLKNESCTAEERQELISLIHAKAVQINDLSAILLDGGRRNPEHFDNALLLMEQLVSDFEAELEDDFCVSSDLSCCPHFSGTFDVHELRRIFDNLISNIRKYADPAKETALSICLSDGQLIIRQSNSIRTDSVQSESYKMGINSIRRISHNYSGRTEVANDGSVFEITVTLSDF